MLYWPADEVGPEKSGAAENENITLEENGNLKESIPNLQDTRKENDILILSPRLSVRSDCDQSVMTNFTLDTRVYGGEYSSSNMSVLEARAFKREKERLRKLRESSQAKHEQEEKIKRIKENRKKMLSRPVRTKKKPSKSAPENLKVGDAVLLRKRGLGIIRYKGPIHCDDKQDLWLGVELKTPDGKNDGTVQNKKYFDCPPNHGVFVMQVKRKIEPAELLSNLEKLKKENDQIAKLKNEIRQTKREFDDFKIRAENFEQRMLELTYPLLTKRGAGALVGQLEATGKITSEIILRPMNEMNEDNTQKSDSEDEKSM